MSSHNSSPPVTPNHQKALWTILCSHFPTSIVKTLQSTPNIHSYELHLLYTILISCKSRTPDHLFIKIHTLPNCVAAEIISALDELDIRPPISSHQQNTGPDTGHIPDAPASVGCKPLFYNREREELYNLVQCLFAARYLGVEGDRSKRAEIHDFETLHVLYRLDAEHCRSKRCGGTELTDPNHEWYHESSDALVAHWTRHLRPLAQHGQDNVDEEDAVVIKLEFE